MLRRKTSTPAPTVDEALALQMTVQPKDLGPRWTLLRTQTFAASAINAAPTCLVNLPPGYRSAAASREYSFDLQRNGLEAGHLVSTVLLQASVHDAAVTRIRLLASGYGLCAEADAVNQVTGGNQAGAHVVSVTPLSPPESMYGLAERVSIAFTRDGVPDSVTADIYDLVEGLVEIRTYIQACSCQPFNESQETALLQTQWAHAQPTRPPG
jgi:hypothetical protein